MKGYPTLLLFEDGLVREKYSGSRDLQELIKFVSSAAVEEYEKVQWYTCRFTHKYMPESKGFYCSHDIVLSREKLS